MALIQSTAIPSGATDYELDQSLRFNDDDSAYLSWTPTSAGNRKTWTWSGWFKRANLTNDQTIFQAGTTGGNRANIYLANNTIQFLDTTSTDVLFTSSQLLRDVSSWYHLVVQFDTTQGTASDRLKMYLNGTRITAFSDSDTIAQNTDGLVNSTIAHAFGTPAYNSAIAQFDGYLAEVNFIDGQALTSADFGETGDYGEWKPIEYEGTYGTNGFYLPFKQDYTVEGFSATTYRGNATTNYIGGVGFQPDFVWMKNRELDASGGIYDSVRGAGVNHSFKTDSGASESYSTDNMNLVSFDSDGFTLGATSGTNQINYEADGHIAWCWDMGGSNATNTSGTITSTVRANTTYGQSVVSYTGSGTTGTVGHGLSSAPDMYIVKNRDAADDWAVYHTSIGNAKRLSLNDANAEQSTNNWNSTSPTSDAFTVYGGENRVNDNGEKYIAYCFHSVTGYSKFGSYTGNGSTTGPSVTTGFKPAFVMLKKTNASGTMWMMFDSTRSPNNTISEYLDASSSSAEGSYPFIDFNSNGFQLKHSSGHANGNGDTYIYMAFADTREYAYWLDQSGNNNDWTSNNLTESDISVDSPTNNFPTWNPLDNAASFTLSEGNLKSAVTGVNDLSPATFGMSSGKWYFEYYLVSGSDDVFGVSQQGKTDWNSDTGTWVLRSGSGSGAFSWNRDTSTNYDFNNVNDFTNADVVSVAVDMDSGKIWFAINGTWNPDASNNTPNPASGTYPRYSNLSGTIVPVVSQSLSDDASTWVANFGQDSSFAGNKTAQGNQDGNSIGDFYYTPPTGFLALCTKNLPDVAVVPSEHFNTLLYTGDGASTHAVTGVGFQPDWVWLKHRTATYHHSVWDSVRGVHKQLYTSGTNAEADESTSVKSFDTDGFTLGNKGNVNNDSGAADNFVAWNWKANGSGSSNTNGSVTSTVSANVDAGFSIVSYTGNGTANQTVGHGLSKTPEIIIIKGRENAHYWSVINPRRVSTSNTNMLYLNVTNAEADDTNVMGDNLPTATTFGVDDYEGVNVNNLGFIAYCFHSVDGYSKFGSYTGNGNADGTFVYTGFKPAFVMIKAYSDSGEWPMYDNKRNPSNVTDEVLKANSTAAEATQSSNAEIDMYSNGFKPRGVSGWQNTDGRGYIYIAFAETPFKYSNAR